MLHARLTVPKPVSRAHARSHRCSRSLATSSIPTYSPKVQAFPFVRSPLEAITNLAPQAATAALQIGSAWRSWLAKRFPSRFQSFQPTRFRAVYYPAWIVVADVRADVSADDEQEKPALLQVLHGYMPGHTLEPLSRISFNRYPSPMSPLDPLPWEPSLATQHDLPVQCLPFQISPFPILEKLRKVSPREGIIKDGLRFDPSTVRFNFLAAHPVLLPLYLAEYDSAYGEPFTMIYEAHNDRMLSTDRTFPFLAYLSSSSAPAPSKPRPRINKLMNSYISHLSVGGGAAREINEAAGYTAPAYALRGFHDQIAALRAIEARAAGWLARGAARQTPVDMQDLRVRPYSERASYDVLRFLQLSDRLVDMVERLEIAENRIDRWPSHVKLPEVMIEARQEAHQVMKFAREQYPQSAPAWWKEWLKREKGKTKN